MKTTDKELDGVKSFIDKKEKLSKDSLDEVYSYEEFLRESSLREEQISSNVITEDKKEDAKGYFQFLRRWRKIDKDEALKNNEEISENITTTMGDMLKGAVAGFSVGKVIDTVLPREELDRMTDIRESFIRMYGSDGIYKKIKSEMYDRVREMNDGLGVAAFSGEDIYEGMQAALYAKVPEDLASSFAVATIKLRGIGVDVGEDFAKNMAMGFDKNASNVMEDIANVLTITPVSESIKTSIANAVGDAGITIKEFAKSDKDQVKSASNLAATLGQLEKDNIMSVDQAKEIQDLITRVTHGDNEALTTVAKLGLDGRQLTDFIKKGNWGEVYGEILEAMTNLNLNSESLKAMDLNLNDETIKQINARKQAIYLMTEGIMKSTHEATKLINGYSQAERRAGSVAESSLVDRIKNYASVSQLVETISGGLEKMNVDASTASSVIGGVVGAAKGIFDTYLLMKIAGKGLGVLKVIGSIGSGIMAIFSGIGGVLSTIGTVIGGVVSAISAPVLVVVAAVTALAGAGYLIYKNWDKLKGWFGAIWKNMTKSLNKLKENFINTFSGIWSNLKDTLLSVKRGVLGFYKSLWGFYKDLWESFTGKLGEVKEKVVNSFSDMWESLKGMASNAKDNLLGGITKIPGVIKSMVKNAINVLFPLLDKFNILKKGTDWILKKIRNKNKPKNKPKNNTGNTNPVTNNAAPTVLPIIGNNSNNANPITNNSNPITNNSNPITNNAVPTVKVVMPAMPKVPTKTTVNNVKNTSDKNASIIRYQNNADKALQEQKKQTALLMKLFKEQEKNNKNNATKPKLALP